MVLHTKRLFIHLLRIMHVDAVADIGSMNGADAVAFHDAWPRARIYAFEPNPHNLQRIARDGALKQRGIEVLPVAAANRDGEAEFFIVAADYSRLDERRGMSSLHRRPDERSPSEVTRVKTVRLDTFFNAECPAAERLALWIDTEGKGYEVIEGMAGIASRVYLLHIEVETVPCISPDQKCYPEVKRMLQGLGFTELAIDAPPSANQFNALFMRTGLPRSVRARIAALRVRARVRHLAFRAVLKLCPACTRRYRAWRSGGVMWSHRSG